MMMKHTKEMEAAYMSNLTHMNKQGRAKMVDVSVKPVTLRKAVAKSSIQMNAETFALIKEGKIKKGDVLAVAQVAGIMAAKGTPGIIPMCHPIIITGADINFTPCEEESRIDIEATVTCTGVTGVEMEALTAASAAALTIYDMCKAVQRDMVIGQTFLVHKSGGKSGTYERGEN